MRAILLQDHSDDWYELYGRDFCRPVPRGLPVPERESPLPAPLLLADDPPPSDPPLTVGVTPDPPRAPLLLLPAPPVRPDPPHPPLVLLRTPSLPPDDPPPPSRPLGPPSIAPDRLEPLAPPLPEPSLVPDDPPAPDPVLAPPPVAPDPLPAPDRPAVHLAPRLSLTAASVSQAGAHRHGSLEVLQPLYVAQDVVATWGQHLQVRAGDVVWLPIEVCTYLLANQPGYWQQLTVVPSGTETGLDSGSGLDVMDLPSTLTWGISSTGAYFSPDGDVGHDEPASLSIDQDGRVYLYR